MQKTPKNIAVIGGGIAGLAAAHRLMEIAPDANVSLLEASDRLGGSLRTVERDGFIIEQGADSFITNVPWGVDLCRRVGLADELTPTNDTGRRALIIRRGKLLPVPDGFMLMAPSRAWPILSSSILSPWGKLRLACEYFVPRRSSEIAEDESLASFVRRRLGREAFDRLVQPLVAGIYTADPEKLSLAATLPRFIEMERQHGGLIRAARRQRRANSGANGAMPLSDAPDGPAESGARFGLFVTPRRGLSSLVDAIANRLPTACVRLNTRVERIERTAGGFRLTVADPVSRQSTVDVDSLIIAAPAPVAATLVRQFDSTLAENLSAIQYAGAVVVSTAYDREQIKHPLDGFGFVVPAIENRKILSASFSSVKFPARAPDGKTLIRTFIGGACQSELAELPDARLEKIVAEELGELIGLSGPPLFTTIARWSRSMPQYHLGHVERVAQIETRAAQIPGLALAGNTYHGVGIPQAIHSGEQAAEKILTAEAAERKTEKE